MHALMLHTKKNDHQLVSSSDLLLGGYTNTVALQSFISLSQEFLWIEFPKFWKAVHECTWKKQQMAHQS